MAANCDLFVIHGPPSPGVTSVLKQRLPDVKKYIHVHPSQLYIEHPDFGVRDIANHVLTLLKKHRHVVVEDNCASGGVRDCLIKIIPVKLPACRVHVVEMTPRHGQQQTLWERQFYLAASTLPYHLLSDDQLLQWFDAQGCCITSNSSATGSGLKESVIVDLTATSVYKFEVPCLLVQWECVVDSGGYLEEKMKTICQHWTQANLFGRVILLCDGLAVAKGSLSAAQQKTQIIQCSKALAIELSCPVFVVQVTSTLDAGEFTVVPNPGLLAFLQQRHCIDLHHRSTVYVYSDIKHMKMAERAGVRHIKIGNVLRNPKVMRTCHSAATCPVPKMLQKIQLLSDPSVTDTPSVPLADRLGDFVDHYVSFDHPRSLHEFAFAQDVQLFHRYQAQYKEHATPVGQPGSRLERQQTVTINQFVETSISEVESTLQDQTSNPGCRQIPEWMLGRGGSTSEGLSAQASLEKSSSTSSVEGGGRTRHTIYIMTEKELLETAKAVLKQAEQDDTIQTSSIQSGKVQCADHRKKEVQKIIVPASSVPNDTVDRVAETSRVTDEGTLKERDIQTPRKKQRLSPTAAVEEQDKGMTADVGVPQMPAPQTSSSPKSKSSSTVRNTEKQPVTRRKPPDLSILDEIFS